MRWRRTIGALAILLGSLAQAPPAPRHDLVPPALPSALPRPAILLFYKANGYRHVSIPAANEAIMAIARRRGWGIFATDNGAAFTPELLRRFDAVVFNNVSGDVFTAEQRRALEAYVRGGGGFVGLHGAGGDKNAPWTWYVDNLVGAGFIGHPSKEKQFQEATLRIEDRSHPATRHLPRAFRWTDEWYSFDRNVRGPGVTVLASLDEGSYEAPDALRMGDHPIIWTKCLDRGRVFFSALGHKPETWAETPHVKLVDGAIAWAARRAGKGCGRMKSPRATP